MWCRLGRVPLAESRPISAAVRASGSAPSTIQTMGVGLAAAVAFDAFVVRMAIAPAVLALLGHRAWWLPRILNRVLPNIDIEGEALSRRVPASATGPDAAVRRLPVGRD